MDATESKSAGSSRGIWPWVALALVVAGVYIYLVSGGRFGGPQGTTGPGIGRKLMLLELEPLTGDGQGVHLADLNGRVSVLNFWGTWCPPCRVEFPHMVDLAGKLAPNADFQVLSVSCEGGPTDRQTLREETEGFLKSQGAAITTYYDADMATRRSVALACGLENFAYPTTLIFDRRGTIRGFWQGFQSGDELAMTELVAELLHQSPEQAGR